MKKIVSVLVGAIAVLAVVIVAFFGTNPVGIEPVIYISSLTILDTNGHDIEKGEDVRTLELPFEADDKDADGNDIMSYWFEVRILPENVTSRSVIFWSAPDSFIHFASSSAFAADASVSSPTQASHTGALVIKKAIKSDPSKPLYHALKIHCKPDDGGAANEDVIYLVVKY